MVTPEHFQPGKLAARPARPSDHRRNPDYRRHRKGTFRRVDETGAVLQHLRLLLLDEDDGASHTADIERFITQVQHQNWTIIHSRYPENCFELFYKETGDNVQNASVPSIKDPGEPHGGTDEAWANQPGSAVP